MGGIRSLQKCTQNEKQERERRKEKENKTVLITV